MKKNIYESEIHWTNFEKKDIESIIAEQWFFNRIEDILNK